ncbi:hypothetical protein [Spiroplasma endosymbiont of Labia minor]|uniref:hypothetical protein n=1 Tax=Spiroplasma endosymbiont of Labia minor TaxID=3066305 RepID=UPI0030D0C1BC
MKYNNLTNHINIDANNHYYIAQFDKHKIPQSIDNKISEYIDKNNIIMLPTVTTILDLDSPYFKNYVPKKNLEIAINRGIQVHELVDEAIKKRNGPKINTPNNEDVDKFHMQLVKRIISELNAILYTYKISEIYSEQSYFYSTHIGTYLGTTDILLKTQTDGWILIDLKTSRTNHIERYTKQLNLYKTMIEEANSNIKITKLMVINPRTEITIININIMNQKQINQLISLSNRIIDN